jgi:hypothetical protein
MLSRAPGVEAVMVWHGLRPERIHTGGGDKAVDARRPFETGGKQARAGRLGFKALDSTGLNPSLNQQASQKDMLPPRPVQSIMMFPFPD